MGMISRKQELLSRSDLSRMYPEYNSMPYREKMKLEDHNESYARSFRRCAEMTFAVLGTLSATIAYIFSEDWRKYLNPSLENYGVVVLFGGAIGYYAGRWLGTILYESSNNEGYIRRFWDKGRITQKGSIDDKVA